MLRTVGRLILIPIAFLLAACASVFVLVTLGLEKITHAMHGQEGGDFVESSLDLLTQGLVIASGATILPALALVIVGEVARIRSWLYYMLGGGAAMAAMPLIARLDQTGAPGLAQATVWQVFATAGFAGGLVYWLLAGRNA